MHGFVRRGAQKQCLPIKRKTLYLYKTGRLLVNRTIGRPIVRLSGSLGCAPSLMLSILYLNLTPDSFDGFFEPDFCIESDKIVFFESDTCGRFATEICSVFVQVRFKSCVRFLQISPIRMKSTIVRFGISARLPESEILPDSSSKPDSHKLPESMCQDQIHDLCPIRSVFARFSTLARFKVRRIRFDFFVRFARL